MTVSDQQRNADRLRAALDAHRRGDVDGVLRLWSDTPVFHRGGPGALGGTYRGAKELADLLSRDAAIAQAMAGFESVDILAGEGHGAAVFTVTAERDGRAVGTSAAYAVRFDHHGRLQEGWFFVSDHSAWQQIYG